MTDLPVLCLPPEPGRLVPMANLETIPWEPNGGFTVEELGERLRNRQPFAAWLEEYGLELWGVDAPQGQEYGSWYVLVTAPFKKDFVYDKEVLNR